MNLTTTPALAEQFGITEARLNELRRTRGWPCVRFGRFDYRFTDEQVEQIIAMQSVAPKRVAVGDERTAKSAASKRAS